MIKDEQAEAEIFPEFVRELIGDYPSVYDMKKGRFLSKEEVIRKMNREEE